MRTIIHIVPDNLTVSGGMKVHFQLSALERQIGLNSYVAFPDKTESFPTWMQTSCIFTTYTDAKAMIDDTTTIIGWEDLGVLQEFNAPFKVAYIQGHSFFNTSVENDDVTLWFSTLWNKQQVKKEGPIIPPFLSDIFMALQDKETQLTYLNARSNYFPEDPNTWKILVQARKHGESRWNQVQQYLSFKPQVTVLPDRSEGIFMEELSHHNVFFAHSYPEGLGLPALEAMALGTVVVGYPGGGGNEYMVNGVNCYMSRDGDSQGVARSLNDLASRVSINKDFVAKILLGGMQTASVYNKFSTTHQLINALTTLWDKKV